MKSKIVGLFYGIMAVVFVSIYVNLIFQNEYYKTYNLVLATIFGFVLIAIIYKCVWKYNIINEKNYKKILILFALGFFAVEILIGLNWKYDPQWDIGALHKAAAEWANTGTFENYYEYFSEFSNNLGAMAFLFIFAKIASVFGITNFYIVYLVVNSFLVTMSIVLVSLSCKRLYGVKHAGASLLICAFSIQLYFFGGAIYTDSLSMLFPILIFWLYLISKEKQGKYKWIIYLIMGIATSIGMLIKFPVLIMAIAIDINLGFKRGFKEAIKMALCVGGVIIIILTSFNSYIFKKHLDREHQRIVSRPILHWVMMGLKDDGRFNSEDYVFTDSFTDPELKRIEIKKKIKERINELGFSGMYNLILKKSVLDFGDGTYGMADFLGQPSEVKTKLHDVVTFDGEHYEEYSTIVTGMHMVIMLLMILGILEHVKDKSKRDDEQFSLYLSIFGLWLFLICWETNRRYFSNFLPIIFVCATFGIELYMKLLKRIKPT